jgi:delta 1-pyrroline-5-carboxylate dehydrogenase
MQQVTSLTLQGPVVILPLREYEALKRRIEELEDALAQYEVDTPFRPSRFHGQAYINLITEETASYEISNAAKSWSQASVEERKQMAREIASIFQVQDPNLLHWVVEEVSLFDEIG